MTRPSAFFLVPEWGQQRTASLYAYLSAKYALDLGEFALPPHSTSTLARIARNARRSLLSRPPLFDRYSGFDDQITRQIRGHYRVAVVEHFWCASYARVLRPRADLLVLDLHNIESRLARTHAQATRGVESIAFNRFARAYEKLEREWLPHFDMLLVTSDEDRARVNHPHIVVYPNALREVEVPMVEETDCLVFSGNMEYHPNVEAVRWFHLHIWPSLREQFPTLEWWLVGRKPGGVEKIVRSDTRIRLTGAIDDALPCIARAKIAIVPLRSGSGTRFKILEAWAAKRAVVSTSIGAEGLGARDREHLLIADNPDAFAQSIAKLLRDSALRNQLGEHGNRLYQERFTWPIAWRALEAAGI